METMEESAGRHFDAGFGCAESVLLAVAEHQGFHSELIPRIATGFCGGIARSGNICGAVSGAVMAVNLIHGRTDPKASKEENYARVGELIRLFESRFGTTNCRELIGCDLGTQAGLDYFKEHNLLKRCREFTTAAAEIVAGII